MSGGEDEVVLSVRRPLMVQRSTSAEIIEPPSDNPGFPSIRKQEFYSEEIEQHAHVTMETPRTVTDVINDMNWRNFFYFAFLITASMFVSLGAEVPTLWLISGISTISLILFRVLKL